MIMQNSITVKIKTADILDALKKNRDIHIKEYQAARIEYFKTLERNLSAMMANAKQQYDGNYNLHLQVPVNREDEYNSYIGQLELALPHTEFLELSTAEYRNFIEDKWEWAVAAKMTNSTYFSGLGDFS